MNFVTDGLVPITCESVPRRAPNHPGEGDDDARWHRSQCPRQMEPTIYVITFKGEAGRTVSAAFDDLEVSTKEGLTTLRATVPDQAALHGVIERIRALGLELVAVRVTTDDEE
jgi:hypothetical protein